ncbi:hypothetical protein NE237_024249 [Protea cynaroides]|uniref:Inositol-pentakisphosphate 2-kinase n=1 Tax=Protea cynaroides TaxID=273540 RepID=A0A9Q0K6Q0_9MAGN|nr:hypothetical protein NE237_024249 [Protea cynaroides]
MTEISKGAIESMEVVLEEKDVADWIYRGEGAANLVLAYTGSSPDFVGKVLRIQKAPRSSSQCTTDTSVLSTFECLLWKDTNDLVSSTSMEAVQQLYVLYVMRPMLGSEHVDAGVRVLVSRKFLESVENNVLCQRPAWRVNAAKVNTLCDSALLISDHSVFPHGPLKREPCISMEIKVLLRSPNVVIPCSRFITEGNAIKRTITRFECQISRISEYNPLDLFSGLVTEYIRLSRLSLPHYRTIFVYSNGSLILGAWEVALKILISWIVSHLNTQLRVLFKWMMACIQRVFNSFYQRQFSDLVCWTGLSAQKLDQLDIEGAIHAYYNIVSQPCKVCRDLGDSELSRMYLSLHSISLEESLKIDCSLMISFRPREDGDPGSAHNSVFLKSTNQSFDYKVNFIDLDLKPLKNMVYYYELDQKIVSCYTSNGENGAWTIGFFLKWWF